MNFLIKFLILIISTSGEGSNMLAVLPVASKSHHAMFQPIINGLANKGHNITLISPHKITTNSRNINQIVIHTSLEEFIDSLDFEELLKAGNAGIFVPKMTFWPIGLVICEEYLKSDEVQKLIHSKDDKFDIILLESSFAQESLMGFSHKFNAPIISLNSVINFLFLDEFIGNPLSLSFVPHSESQLMSPMTFYQRLWNTVRSVVLLTSGYHSYLPNQEMLMKKYFNYTAPENIPPLIEMLKNNISLAISNSHISVENARPLVPNVISAAGLHINKNPPSLPKDTQEYMDKAKNGVIYFSFGTIVPVHRMPLELKNEFFKAFSKLKQNILWKANVDSMENLPKNVKVAKWLPQQSILAHPNCVAFITHGGLLSLQESIYFGVPLIAVPMFSDQFMNIGRAVNLGFAVKLDLKNLTEESIFNSVNEVLTNKRYHETAKKYSVIFRDNPIDPLDNAIFWIEYVIRHKGARHLRTSKLDLNLFQYLLIDVIVFIIFVIMLLLIFTYFIIKLIVTKFFKQKINEEVKNKKDD